VFERGWLDNGEGIPVEDDFVLTERLQIVPANAAAPVV